jgi:hypothetical protein
MKYIAIVSFIFLAACGPEENSDHTNDVTTICLDGVAYWHDGFNQSQMMAPRIDPKTLTFVLCDMK